MYKEGMLCKHFKGKTLLDKNIYRIIKLGLSGKDVDTTVATYTGEGILEDASNLVLYQNIFQENKFFVREYEDISFRLSDEKRDEFGQEFRVEPLSEEEIDIVSSEEFRIKKINLEEDKRKNK